MGVAQVLGPQPAPKQLVRKENTPLPLAAAAAPAPQIGAQTFSFMDGLFSLDLKTVPVRGPLNAPKKVAKLFDYTCHHCRTLHHLLSDFQAKHSNELAVISLQQGRDVSELRATASTTVKAILAGALLTPSEAPAR